MVQNGFHPFRGEIVIQNVHKGGSKPLAEFGVLLQRSKNGGVANALPLVKAEGIHRLPGAVLLFVHPGQGIHIVDTPLPLGLFSLPSTQGRGTPEDIIVVVAVVQIAQDTVDGGIVNVALDIRLLLEGSPLGWVGEICILHPAHEGGVVILLGVKVVPLLNHAVFHQHPVVHLVVLTEILLVIALEHIAVVPVLPV